MRRDNNNILYFTLLLTTELRRKEEIVLWWLIHVLSLQIRMKTMPASMYRLLVGLETPQHIWSNQRGIHAYVTGAPLKKDSPSVTQSERTCHAMEEPLSRNSYVRLDTVEIEMKTRSSIISGCNSKIPGHFEAIRPKQWLHGYEPLGPLQLYTRSKGWFSLGTKS